MPYSSSASRQLFALVATSTILAWLIAIEVALLVRTVPRDVAFVDLYLRRPLCLSALMLVAIATYYKQKGFRRVPGPTLVAAGLLLVLAVLEYLLALGSGALDAGSAIYLEAPAAASLLLGMISPPRRNPINLLAPWVLGSYAGVMMVKVVTEGALTAPLIMLSTLAVAYSSAVYLSAPTVPKTASAVYAVAGLGLLVLGFAAYAYYGALEGLAGSGGSIRGVVVNGSALNKTHDVLTVLSSDGRVIRLVARAEDAGRPDELAGRTVVARIGDCANSTCVAYRVEVLPSGLSRTAAWLFLSGEALLVMAVGAYRRLRERHWSRTA